jgi:hypothetical protein
MPRFIYRVRHGVIMPLTPKGKRILTRMKKTYGAKKGKQVFHASINKKKPGTSKWHSYKKGRAKKK